MCAREFLLRLSLAPYLPPSATFAMRANFFFLLKFVFWIKIYVENIFLWRTGFVGAAHWNFLIFVIENHSIQNKQMWTTLPNDCVMPFSLPFSYSYTRIVCRRLPCRHLQVVACNVNIFHQGRHVPDREADDSYRLHSVPKFPFVFILFLDKHVAHNTQNGHILLFFFLTSFYFTFREVLCLVQTNERIS